MKYVKLGSSSLEVSAICLGSMTWGLQNNQSDADAQLDYAQQQGINFIDTAEMYAVPPTKETYGATEAIIGNWLNAKPSRREDIVLASKIAGPGFSYIRDGSKISGANVITAVETSLKRLQTDYIDLYQLHWPNRQSPHFGEHWPNKINYSQVDAEQQNEEMLDILQGLEHCVKAGKIRYCGLSDDTPWGINQYLRLSAEHNLPRMVSIQNEFSLLHTKDWPYLIENCIHEDIAYLPWSPLATGLLTGKYLNGQRPEGSRFTLMQRNGLFRDTQHTNAAVHAYVALAKKHNISPAHLALAWCDQVDGVTSTIIGATNMQQLKQNIAAFKQPLTAEVLEDINQTLKQHPCPF
ncbi:aldo/keto reductase [Colwellia sp. M166]|uniref:aldo/keto reductase n=1 Tax=Colwellia sp. M166 TaxID=2583805 RepID=UPI00211E5E75|nr:aldo/keto reductase [Colwellia sp. M166]UUO21941.1 aldo/keto reductase [Colwellia sp. M166]|tara:strand:- start:6647 stop:7699 length:1053 start_codon:yes stop_codon:yes gene_type:complete